MPTGIYERTKENKGCFKKGHQPLAPFKKGMVAWSKGKKLPQMSGKNNPMWKDGTHINNGYKYILRPNHPFAKKSGYIAEHRVVLEEPLKRYLTKKEIPHHINHIRTDNRLENLMLFASSASHVRFEHNCSVRPEEIVFDGRKIKCQN